MTVLFIWADPRGLCRVCAEEPEASTTHGLCANCTRRCATYLATHTDYKAVFPDLAVLDSLPDRGDGLPEDDARVIAWFRAWESERADGERLRRGEFREWEVETWIAFVLEKPHLRKWLKLEGAAA